MKKRKLTAQQKKLQADFDKMMQAHAKPLEKGARAKGLAVGTPPPTKRGQPLFEARRKNTEQSLDTGYNSTAPRQQMMYSGDKMIGVALMHKSTYAPVFNPEAAADIAKMRRG